MSTIRPPAVAGVFYPSDPVELRLAIRRQLADVHALGADAPVPRAVIVPHAGYVYSGPVAASVYARLAACRGRVRRVVLLGPSHRVPLAGLAAPSVEGFATPLGTVPIDREAVARLAALPQVAVRDDAHRDEHSLEVQLPFLQEVLGRFSLVPLVVGDTPPEAVAEVIEALWDEPGTLVVVSSDLSHYHDYATARRRDAATSRAIEALDPGSIGPEDACGCHPVGGLLVAARRHGLGCRVVDLRSSGDTAGPRDRVVGYGSYVVA
ncbi:MAG TPA: AmmeMemoRadiSam system protein B [Myxococcota bacterium]|nr:AmmeMemoRadiSam system protein B [Myxococcota bacterium]